MGKRNTDNDYILSPTPIHIPVGSVAGVSAPATSLHLLSHTQTTTKYVQHLILMVTLLITLIVVDISLRYTFATR